jgi:tRNA (guanine37-N1)-methyltransferase
MRIDIITVVPNLLESPLNTSILKRAQNKGLVKIKLHNLRDYSTNKQKSVDDTPFGGGAGMVIQIQPIADCIEKLKSERVYDEIIYMTPDGETMKQGMVNTLSLKKKYYHFGRALQRNR